MRLSAIFYLALSAFVACFCLAAPAQGGPSAVSAKSLVGTWEFAVNGPIKLVLHLKLDASGALAGTIEVPGANPPVQQLTNVYVSGRTLSYKMPGFGQVVEQVSADGDSMVGSQMWVRVKSMQTSVEDVAGDWEWVIGGPLKATLHLRLDASGALTGTLDNPMPTLHRIVLSNVRVSGRMLTYTMMPEGGTFEGTISADGKTIAGTPKQGQATIQWDRVRTLAEARREDAKVKPSPTDGTWSGVVHHGVWKGEAKPANDTLHLVFHFSTSPLACSFDSPEQGGAQGIGCEMKLTGNKIHVTTVRITQGTYDGVLSGDGTRITGTWTVGSPWNWGPMELDLTRTDK